MNKIIRLLFVVGFIITYLTNVGIMPNNITTTVMFVMSVFLYSFSKKSKRRELTLVLLIFLLLLNYIIMHSGIGGCMGIVTLFLFVDATNSLKTYNLPSMKVFSLISFLCLIHFFITFKSSLGVNTNTLGLIAYYLFLIIVPLFIIYKNKSRFANFITLIILFIGMGLSVTIIMFSGCRSALFGLISTFCLFVLFSVKALSTKFLKFFSFSLLFGGGLYAIYSAYLYKNNIEFFFFKWLTTSNKNYVFSGREAIWTELLNNFYSSPILGSGNHISLMSFESLACHNSVLAIMCIYGFPIFLLVFTLLWKCMKKALPYMDNVLIRYFFSFFCANLIIGLYESNLIDDFKFFSILPLLIIVQLLNLKYHENCNSLHLYRSL